MRVQVGEIGLDVVRLPATGPVTGPPIVLLHGALIGSVASWYFTCAPALAEERELVLYDLRGHGRSDRVPTGYDLDTQAGDLIGLLDALQLDQVDLIGHSLGALIALRAAHLYPTRVRKLVMVDAPVPPSARGLLNSLGAGMLEGTIDPTRVLELMPEGARAVVESGGRRAARFLDGLTFLLTGTTLLADLEAAVVDRKAPEAFVLCIYGEDSACLAAGERLAVDLEAGFVTVPGGHFVPLTAPDPLTHHALAFLDA
jgi:esterase